MKKRNIAWLLVVLMVISLIAGCSNDSLENEGNENSPVTTNVLSGGTADKWFMLSSGFSEALNKTYPGSILHIAPGNPAANILALNANEAEFGLCHTNLAYEAYTGTGQFEEAKDNITAVALLYSSPAQMIFREETGITSFTEIVENKIPIKFNAGRLGGSMETVFQKILAEYGITYDDMLDWGCTIYKKGFADTSDMFADEVIDGFFIVAGAPTLFPTQLSVNSDMVMLEWEPWLIDTMVEKYGFSNCIISSDIYTFMDSDVKSFNSYNVLCANINTSEDTVYKMTKALYENLDYIQSLHASFLEITTKSIAGDAGIPYHPGAVKYYAEIGLMEPLD